MSEQTAPSPQSEYPSAPAPGPLQDPEVPAGIDEDVEAVAWGYPDPDADDPDRSRAGPFTGPIFSVRGPTGLRMWYIGGNGVDVRTARPVASDATPPA